MKKRRVLWAVILLAGCFCFGLTIPTSRFWLLGTLRHERFYNGKPASYWINELAEVKSRNTGIPSILNQIKSVIGMGTPDGESWTPKNPCPADTSLLIEMMSDQNPELRRRVTFALEHHDPFPREAIPSLLNATHDPDDHVRMNAGTALLRSEEWSPEMVAAIMALVKDPNPNVRQVIAISIPYKGASTEALTPALFAMQKDRATFPAEAAIAIFMIELPAAGEGGTRLAQLHQAVGPNEKPIWCNNTLTISGPPDAVKDFVAKAKGKSHSYRRGGQAANEGGIMQELCFHALYPIPQDVLDAGFDPIGYRWEISHWDCTGGAHGSRFESMEPGKAQFVYRTTWGPPNAFFEKVAKDFPILRFENDWKTPDLGYKGQSHWQPGWNSKGHSVSRVK